MGFKDKLKLKLASKLTEEELSLLPRGFQSLGHIMILKLNQKLLDKKILIAETSLVMFPKMKSVYINLGKVSGTFREPENIQFLLGEDNPIVTHREHGIIYRFDFTKIMFSQGNLNERKYLATLVKENEVVVDMFAGIGYFSLPIGKHSAPKRIYSVELNPLSYDFLVQNIKLNHLEELITPILGDCKEEVVKLSKSGVKADRVIMGIFPAPKESIKDALTLVKETGTIFHYEGIVDNKNYMTLYGEFKKIAEDEHFSCELKEKRYVKSFGPKLYHTVLDIFVSPINQKV